MQYQFQQIGSVKPSADTGRNTPVEGFYMGVITKCEDIIPEDGSHPTQFAITIDVLPEYRAKEGGNTVSKKRFNYSSTEGRQELSKTKKLLMCALRQPEAAFTDGWAGDPVILLPGKQVPFNFVPNEGKYPDPKTGEERAYDGFRIVAWETFQGLRQKWAQENPEKAKLFSNIGAPTTQVAGGTATGTAAGGMNGQMNGGGFQGQFQGQPNGGFQNGAGGFQGGFQGQPNTFGANPGFGPSNG